MQWLLIILAALPLTSCPTARASSSCSVVMDTMRKTSLALVVFTIFQICGANQSSATTFSSQAEIPGHPPPPPTCSDESCVAAQKAYAGYYKTYVDGLAAIQLRAFKWQFGTSVVLLVVVVVICIAGVIFSGFQLYWATAHGAHRPRPEEGTAEKPKADQLADDKLNVDRLATNVELSWQSVRVTSSVIGLVVLVISLAFFYLFLKDVYPITTVSRAVVAGPPAAPTGNAPDVSPRNQEF
jgi:hypothetical protein